MNRKMSICSILAKSGFGRSFKDTPMTLASYHTLDVPTAASRVSRSAR